ncbi:hypothetical protein LINPERPRIM_LOCUS25479 [Linum perenne]
MPTFVITGLPLVTSPRWFMVNSSPSLPSLSARHWISLLLALERRSTTSCKALMLTKRFVSLLRLLTRMAHRHFQTRYLMILFVFCILC